MDFGVGFLSNNVMLPILDFFYGLAPSYGLAIIALTLVVRVAVFPLSAGSIRNARRMKIVNPLMQERQKEVKERYKDDPAKQQEEVAKIFKEFGNPLAGCLPVLFQMPILFALFATLRGSPFSDINYPLTVQILPQEQMVQVQPQAFTSPPQNIYINDGDRTKIVAVLPGGSNIGVGDKVRPNFQTIEGKPFAELAAANQEIDLTPVWTVTKGSDRIRVNPDGSIEALQPGEATIQGMIPGLAANKGFLFIEKLGQVGARSEDGTIHWDIVGMALAFGLSLYLSQMLSGAGNTGNPQQDQASKMTTLIFSGMFLFFPLPAGVLMYMVIGNLFQTFQTFLLMKEPLPDNIQAMLDAQTKAEAKKAEADGQNRLPFEPKKKKA
jgi:YidC/Oxa1 family membrane protein insertase